MAEPVTSGNVGTTTQGQPAATSAPAPQTQSGDKILGKFESQEALIKSYQELESKLGEYGSKYKVYDKYEEKGGATAIDEVIEYARNLKASLDKGELVYKSALQQQAPSAPAQNAAPWEADDWSFKSPREQSAMMAQFTQGEVMKEVQKIAAQYGQQIQGFQQNDARQKSILLRAITAAIKNPGSDPESILEEAASLGAKTPEQLMEMVLANRANSPENQKSEIEKQVAVRLAEELQKRENAQFTDVLQSKKARFGPKNTTREAENRSILESLAKQNIRLL